MGPRGNINNRLSCGFYFVVFQYFMYRTMVSVPSVVHHHLIIMTAFHVIFLVHIVITASTFVMPHSVSKAPHALNIALQSS